MVYNQLGRFGLVEIIVFAASVFLAEATWRVAARSEAITAPRSALTSPASNPRSSGCAA